MKKIIAALFIAALSAPAFAGVTATMTLKREVFDGKDRIVARVTVLGIEGCPTAGVVRVTWTSPTEMFESSRYDAPYKACSKKGGTARTFAYRTVEPYELNGKKYTAAGTWKVRVYTIDSNGDSAERLAEAEITVE